MKKAVVYIERETVEQYEVIAPLLTQAHRDVQELARKKQDGALNPTRIKILNRLLERARDVLKNEASRAFLDLLDEDLLPQNADALLVVGQYISALQAFRTRWLEDNGFGEYRWKIKP